MDTNTNVFKVAGTIINKKNKGKSIRITLKTSSETRLGEIKQEYPQIYFYGKNKEIADRFNLYDKICVKGVIVTKAFNTEEGRTYLQLPVGASIEARLETNGDNRINVILISGVVKNVYTPTPAVSKITIAVENPTTHRFDYPQVVGYGNAAEFMKNQVKVGDVVQVKSYLQTNKNYSKENSNFYFHDDIVCSAIRVIY